MSRKRRPAKNRSFITVKAGTKTKRPEPPGRPEEGGEGENPILRDDMNGGEEE